jgi:N-acetylglucosamine-6-sulfatase
MGQFNLGACKRQPYDTDIRIPFLIVGPGIAPGVVPHVAGMVDLGPTFLALASQSEQIEHMHMDGRSLLPLLRPSSPSVGAATAATWRDAYLIEYTATKGVVTSIGDHLKDNSNNTFIGLRVLNASHNLAYFIFTDATTDWNFAHSNFCELYDLARDPNQLKNQCHEPAMVGMVTALHNQLMLQFHCHGPSCA